MNTKIEIKDIDFFISNFIDDIKPSLTNLEKYRKFASKNNKYLKLESLSDFKQINQYDYYFISDRPNYFFTRMALCLKKIGYKTCFISRWGPFDYEKKFFNKIYIFDKYDTIPKLKFLKNKTIFIQQWPGFNFIASYIHLILSKKNKLICNINDLTLITYKNKDNYIKIGLNKKELELDIKFEKYNLNNFKLITHFYNKDFVFKKFGNKVLKKINKQIVFFPCYPTKIFFSYKKRHLNLNKINLVYIGNSPKKNAKANFDTLLYKTLDHITLNKIYLTYLNNPQRYFEKNEYVLTEIAKKNKYFKFKKGYLPWELKNKTISFNFGIMPFYFSKNYSNEQMEAISTKIFTYVEQGLPIIATNKMPSISDFIEKNKLGIVLKNNYEITNLKKIIKKYDYNILINNIQNYRNRNSMEKKIDEILNII